VERVAHAANSGAAFALVATVPKPEGAVDLTGWIERRFQFPSAYG